MKQVKKLLTIAFVLASFIFFTHLAEASCPGELGSSDPIPSVWTKECSPYVIKNTINVSVPVTIEPGVVVKFKYAAAATFNNSLTAIGTEKEKIVFTAWTDDKHGGDTNGDLDSTTPKAGFWYRILIGSSATAYFENTLFLYGGEHPFGTLALQPNVKESVSVRNSEFRHNKYSGIYINYNPDQVIENNTFSDNGEGIILNDCTHNLSATISGNSFDGNINFGAKVNYPNYNKIDAQNNWWGDKSGPYHNKTNPNGKGDRVSDGVLYDPWIGKDSNQPVILIPGIMGSWEKDGKWQIDPIFHTYDNLYEEFVNEGYVSEKDLFTFPYEWRDSNKVNAVELKAKIQEIKNETHFPKVDIIAHSMGGLLAREYVESNYYEDDVDQLITIGTPHMGAPGAYVKWEAGESFWNIFDIVGKIIFRHEAKEKGYYDVFHYIRERPMLSVQELLPAYNYLFDVENNYSLRETYPNRYPRNEFLENLNSGEGNNLLQLSSLKFTKVVGKMNNPDSTISGYSVVDTDMGEYWRHGYPHGFEIPVFGDQGLRLSDGDQTVPLYSAEAEEIPDDNRIYLESEHNVLPTDAQKDILEILTGVRPENEVREWVIDDILISMVFSPVDIQIVSPSGKRLGKNFETGGEYNEIEGAFYTGYDTNVEFLTIPNPEKGEYKIITQGTGEGKYKIETTKIKEDKDDPLGAKESTATITGVAETEKTEEKIIEVTEDKVIYNPDITPPAITIISPEEKEYLNNQILPASYTITDSLSESDKIVSTALYDNELLAARSIDLSLEHLGNHEFKITATDEAGNASEKVVNFQNTTNLAAIRGNVGHYWDLKLIKKRYEKTLLIFQLDQLEELFDWLNQFENLSFDPALKILITSEIKKIINSYTNQLIYHINHASPRLIDPKAAELLIEDLDFIRP